MIRAPAADRRVDVQLDAALLGEFEGVRQQVFQYLLQALCIGYHAAVKLRVELHVEGQASILRFVPERPDDHVLQGQEEDLLDIDRDRPRLDLGEIEDVADQVHQVGARAVDRAGKLDLLRAQIAFRIVAELLAQDQDAVERGAQLVRHVGEEVGFVFRRLGELGGLVLERPARLLDFLIFSFDFDVAFLELLRLLLQLLIRLLQLPLLALELGGKLLGLGQQPFGLHCRFDAVQDDPDAGGQLIEKRDLQVGEGRERGQLDDRLDLPLEQHRQNDVILRHCLE